MAVAVGDIITAAQYNTLQGRVSNIMGNGSGQDGYGQTIVSSQVNAPTSPGAGDGDTVEADFMQNLYDDMNRAYKHQTGTDISLILYRVITGNVIGADVTGTDLTYATNGSYTFDNQNTKGGFNDYLSAMTAIESGQFNMAPGQGDTQFVDTSVISTPWNGTIDMEFTVTFTSADHRRHFFNSGGSIRFYGELTSGSGDKDADWAAMLTNSGTVVFNYTSTTRTGTGGTGSSIGNYDVTNSTPQTIFTKSGQDVHYAENTITATVWQDSATVLHFKVSLADNDTGDDTTPGDGYNFKKDENVTGTLTMYAGYRRAKSPTGDTTVDVPAPSVVVTNDL